MQELSNNPFSFSIDLSTESILNNATYQDGFNDGIGAYEQSCEEKERTLTGFEACKDICWELDPTPRQRAHWQMAAQFYNVPVDIDPCYTSGFYAGWIYAHLSLTGSSVAALPTTQPLGVVVPFPGTQR